MAALLRFEWTACSGTGGRLPPVYPVDITGICTVSLSYSRARTFKALLIIMLLGGAMVWLLGRAGTVHIGASGIIFGLIGYLMCLGLFQRNWKALVISVVITIVYGGALYSLLMIVPGVSWSGHLFGFLSGVVAARVK